MEMMKCKVMPLKKYTEISYRVKCVAVESERLFGDVYVAEQTRNIIYCADGYHFPPVYKRSKCNQMHQIMDSPDFMQLNSRSSSRKGSVDAIAPAAAKPLKRRTKSLDHQINITHLGSHSVEEKKPKIYPVPLPQPPPKQEMVSSLVDQLLLDIYGLSAGDRCRSESDSTASSLRPRPQHHYLQRARLQLKSTDELQVLVLNLREHISHAGGLLVRYLRKRDYLLAKRDKQCDVITAHLQAHSAKRIEDTKMRFSLTPQPGESGFQQWLDAMKMVARLQGGIPPEFRKRLWLILAERHLEQRGIDWKQAEKICFNEWSNPDDEELGIQIVKDLHRTGCSLFCGAAGRDNQAVLRRVLLGFARWNKSVGYCQGLNVLAALVLQVMDRAESSAVKVMIYLIEGVLPEGYFADNLRGLSIDMAVFRDLLRSRLPKLSKHLEALQTDAKDKATGSSYEPPLTNVFTMQWFLTLFCHCLPQDTVLRVWDLIFLEGDEILLRTALAIWEGLSDRIMTVTSADEFYSIMGVLTREMLEFTDTNNLIKNIVGMGPLHNVTGLREKHRYNITPWARKLSDDEDSDTEEDERLAVAAAMVSMAQRLKKDCVPSTMGALQSMASSHDRERLALDISTLKQQYAKLRERQRQAHIILSAACARQSMVPQPTSQAMNHLLVGKNALVSGKSRPLSLPSTVVPTKNRPVAIHSPRTQNRRDKQGVTLHWKDTKKTKDKPVETNDPGECGSVVVQLPQEQSAVSLPSPKRSSIDSDSDSTSTELCDESDRLSDLDSEEATSTSECYVMATDQEKSPKVEKLQTEDSSAVKKELDAEQVSGKTELKQVEENADKSPCLTDTSVAKITDQIRGLSAESDDKSTELEEQSLFGDEAASRINFSISESPVHDEDSTNVLTVDRVIDSDPSRKSLRKSDSTDYLDFDHRDDVTLRQSETASSSNETTDLFYTETRDAEETEKVSSVDKEVTDIAENISNVQDNLLADDYRLLESGSKSDDNANNSKVSEDSKQIVSSSTGSRDIQIYSMYESFKIQEKDPEEYNDNTNFNDSVTEKSVNIEEDVSAFAKYENKPLNVFHSEKETLTQKKNSIFDTTTSVHDTKESVQKTDLNAPFSETASITNKLKGDGLNLYSSSYVVGHFPISPASVDQKLQQKLHLSSPLNSPNLISHRVNMDLEIATKTESHLSNKSYTERRSYFDTKKSPRTPDSGTSFSSGETMGPDSKPSSLTMSPKTPIKSDSRDFTIDKSVSSSVSSDSKTLTLRSLDSDQTKDTLKVDGKRSSYEKSSPSTPISTDSLKNKSDVSPKFVVSSSSDSCSPSKVKSSERSFSSDLQSPISANSIKYTSNYNKSSRNSPIDPCAATSPFYPIAHPNQNAPSAYNGNKRSNVENVELLAEQKLTNTKDTSKYLNYQPKVGTSLSEITDRDIDNISRDIYVRPQFTMKKPNTSTDLSSREKDFTEVSDIHVTETLRDTRKFTDDDAEELSEKDELAQLPQEKLDKHYYNYRHSKSTKAPFGRSCSSLERTFASLKSSMSTDELKTSTAKKRSSDILQDMKHLEAKANDETTSSGMMTKKSSYIWEDMKNLEARRQDTFTDSASTFSKRRLDIPDINISAERRNSYVVRPKINIDEGSDSILKSLTRDKNKDNGDSDDGRESKVGVWTKVKPRKKGNNGRRSSDRALKIIQENSVILHKILACQAKKRLPDLEEISKEITISPINEEISKIFSPILEKMGLNEHEINEELARINFKDFDDVAATNVSEFDAKINDELSKLSLIDDTEDIDPLDIDDIASHDYLDTREALIDRKINEELSKLLANYEGESPASIGTLDKGSSQNNSDPEGLDLTSISTNVFSYKSSNDSIETRSDVGSMHESATQPEKFSQYKDSALSYPSSAQYARDLSPKSDIDIYRELEKLDKISSAQVLPETSPSISPKGLSPIQYIPSTSPYTIASPTARYSTKPSTFDASPIKSSYETYKPYEYTSKLSPAKTTSNFYNTGAYDSSDTFTFRDQKTGISENDYDLHKSILSKENLEFRVRYDDEPVHGNHQYLNVQAESMILNKGISYYGTERNKPVTPTKYVAKDERCFESPATTLVEYSSDVSDSFRRKYDPLSPPDYGHEKSLDYNKHLVGLPSVEQKTSGSGSYSPMRHRDVSPLSPNRQFGEFTSTLGHYVSKLSPGFAEEAIRPISHPEFPGKAITSRRPELPNRDAVSYKKSSMSLGNIGYATTTLGKKSQDTSPSPKTQFSPFPVRNIARKPKELTLKLGLYSQKPSEIGQSKKS